MPNRKFSFALALTLALVLAAYGGVSFAQEEALPASTYEAAVTALPLNEAEAQSTAVLTLDGDTLTVAISGEGFAPNLPHAQHLHGAMVDGAAPAGTCPPPEADANGDGRISTPEGAPFYGGIVVSLTTSGDASPSSALAVDRMPVADADGRIDYERTFQVGEEVPEETVAQLGDLFVVQHGIDLDASGEYDGAPSPLDPAVPFEATIPAVCGEISLTQVGDTAVARLAGPTRFETAVEISRYQFPETAEVVYLARAFEFADALAGGTLEGGPILLVPSEGEVPATVIEEIARLQPQRVVPLGGTAAISEDVVVQAALAAEVGLGS